MEFGGVDKIGLTDEGGLRLHAGEHVIEYAIDAGMSAEDENEFFAVASEEFIECPADLLAAHPRLYVLLREFYGIDPVAWAEGR